MPQRKTRPTFDGVLAQISRIFPARETRILFVARYACSTAHTPRPHVAGHRALVQLHCYCTLLLHIARRPLAGHRRGRGRLSHNFYYGLSAASREDERNVPEVCPKWIGSVPGSARLGHVSVPKRWFGTVQHVSVTRPVDTVRAHRIPRNSYYQLNGCNRIRNPVPTVHRHLLTMRCARTSEFACRYNKWLVQMIDVMIAAKKGHRSLPTVAGD